MTDGSDSGSGNNVVDFTLRRGFTAAQEPESTLLFTIDPPQAPKSTALMVPPTIPRAMTLNMHGLHLQMWADMADGRSLQGDMLHITDSTGQPLEALRLTREEWERFKRAGDALLFQY